MTTRHHRFLDLVAVVLVALLAALTGCNGAREARRGSGPGGIAELNFGIISTESAIGLKEDFAPFLEDMERALGVPVNAFFASNYAGIIEAMRFDRVDMAWYGNKSAMEAVDRAGGEVFAGTVSADGSEGYWSLIIVHRDSPYQSIDGIIADGAELTFGNGDPNSTSGYLIPSYYLWAERGIDPDEHFKRVLSSSHGNNCLYVANKTVDFATNNTETLGRLKENDPEAAAKIRVIWQSPLIPNDPLVWRKNLPDEAKQAVHDFIFSYGRGDSPEAQRQRDILASISGGWAPFNEADNSYLLTVREVSAAKELMEVRADASLNANEKAQRISDIEAKLADIRSRREEAEALPSARGN